MNSYCPWFLPNSNVEETDGLTTISDGSEDFYIFIVKNFEFYDESTKVALIDDIKRNILESIENSECDVLEGNDYYLSIEYHQENRIYACLGYKAGHCCVLKFAATASNESGLDKLKNAVNNIKETNQKYQ